MENEIAFILKLCMKNILKYNAFKNKRNLKNLKYFLIDRNPSVLDFYTKE